MIIELYTPKDVAKIFNVNYRKVLDLIALGELQAYRIGGAFRISQSEILRYLYTHKVKSQWK